MDLDRMVLSQGPSYPSPHQLTLRGKEQTKAMRRETRRLCGSKHSPSCVGRTAPTSPRSLLAACANILSLPHKNTPHTSKGWKEQGKLFWGRKETSPSRKRGTT